MSYCLSHAHVVTAPLYAKPFYRIVQLIIACNCNVHFFTFCPVFFMFSTQPLAEMRNRDVSIMGHSLSRVDVTTIFICKSADDISGCVQACWCRWMGDVALTSGLWTRRQFAVVSRVLSEQLVTLRAAVRTGMVRCVYRTTTGHR